MARGGSRTGRNYVRDNSGRFSSTPGGGPAKKPPKPKRGALKASGGTLTVRARLRAARAKLTPGASRQQRAAVTRAENRLRAAKTPMRMKTTATGKRERIAKPKSLKRDPQLAARLAAAQGKGQGGRKPNLRAQQAKAMAGRTGVVPGRLRTDGQDTRTLSLAEMRKAVRQTLRKGGIETRKEFTAFYGKPPTTRSGWEKLYRENVAVPLSEQNRKARPGVINGIDIQKQFRPWQVFKLDPKTATRADVESAFRRVAKQVHPDAGGRRKDFERVKVMRDSLLAFMPEKRPAKPARGGRKGSKKAAPAAPTAPRGPLLLPPARDATPAKPARKRGATAGAGRREKASTKKATGKKAVTGDRVGRMVGRLAARRDQLIRSGGMFDTKAEQSKDVVRRAMAFIQGKAYDKKNSKQQNLELNRQHMKAVAAGRPQDSPLYKSVASAIAATPRRSAGTQRKKTKQEILWQADQIIGKTIKKMAATLGKGKGTPIRTQNSRQVYVERFLARKGLLGEYRRLTAAADPILMTPAGPGIKQPRPRKPRRRKPAS